MLHHDSLSKTDEMKTILAELVHALVMTETENGFGVVALPQVYPGGNAVTVRVQKDGDEFVVTDQGGGYVAAELLGATTVYNRLAPKVAEANGVAFDGVQMFAARVSRDWLANATIFVGTASRQCIEMTTQRVSDEVEHSLRADLQDRIQAAFPGRAALNVELPGRSNRVRSFAALVEAESSRTLFDLVTPHHVSINGAIVKFQDVAQLDTPPSRVAVLSSERRIDPGDISLLAQWTSKIIKLDSETETYLRAA